MADFQSLLSVFRDATAPNNPPRSSASTGQSATATNRPSSGSKEDTSAANKTDVELTSTTDPTYSASAVKQQVERLLRINSIRKSTMSATKNDAEHGIDTTRDTVHIAVCATIVQEFPHEALWKKWIEETGGDVLVSLAKTNDVRESDAKSVNIKASAELYVHAKHPESIQSEWLKSKTLPMTHRPNWNDVRIIRAMLSLLEEAMKDENTTHVLFCTESCVPVVTMREAALSLLLDEPCIWQESETTTTKQRPSSNADINWDRSYIDCYDRNSPRCSRYDEHNCWGHLRDSIPGEAIYKALPGWCLLSRKHAQAILNLPSQLNNMNLWPAFEKVWAPEEVYFPTSLNICGLMDEAVKRSVTHSQWDHKAANLQDRAHPLCYDGQFDNELVSQVRRDGCLFLRKMKQSIDLEVWQNIVIHHKNARDCKTPGVTNSGSKRGRDWNREGSSRDYDRGGRNHRNYSRHRGGSYHSRRDDYSDRRRYDRRSNNSDGYRDEEPHWKRRR